MQSFMKSNTISQYETKKDWKLTYNRDSVVKNILDDQMSYIEKTALDRNEM